MRVSKLIWGTFLLSAAAFILINQISGFTTLGAGSIIVAILSLAFTVQCLARLHIAPLPLPAAVLYIVFRSHFNLPHIEAWALFLTAILASVGLAVLLPRRRRIICGVHTGHKSGSRRHEAPTENCTGGNNPSVSVNFGAVSRRITADALESVQMQCNFGALEVYLDQATPSPNGVDAEINCSFGAVELVVPKEWQIINHLNCSLGGVDVDKRPSAIKEGAPKLSLKGNVSLGGIEVKRV